MYLTYRDNKGINIDIKNVNGGDSSKLNSDSIDKVKLIYGNKQVYLLTPIDVILLKNDI